MEDKLSFEKVSLFEYKSKEKNILGNKRYKLFKSLFSELYTILNEDEINKLLDINKNIRNIEKITVNIIVGSMINNKIKDKKNIYILVDELNSKIFVINGNFKIIRNGGKIRDFRESIQKNRQFRFYEIFM